MSAGEPIKLVRCPTCRKSIKYDTANPNRPFCSSYCKDQDIISWAEESFKIPGKPAGRGGPHRDDDPESDEDL